jgi:hypothetical protein
MIRRSILLVLTGIYLLTLSCNDFKDYSADINIPPILKISKLSQNDFQTMVNDSFKMGTGNSYSLNYSFIYLSNLPINYEFLSGSGTIDINYLKDVITISTQSEEDIYIRFFVEDIYNNISEVKTDILFFKNLPPVALFTYNINGSTLSIDARSSYDKDKKWGGYVTKYEFTLNGVVSTSTDGSYYQEIESNKSYDLKVRVLDNNNTWSDYSESIINNL